MRLWILSDLHLEDGVTVLPPVPSPTPDVLIVAGDTSTPLSDAVHRLATFGIPTVVVAGNHEFYGCARDEELRLCARLARSTTVRLLENESWVYRGVRFLGCTLWTDYALHGDVEDARRRAWFGMMDHARIRASAGTPFTPAHAEELHRRSVAWLQDTLATPFDGPTVIVTHHAPHPRSIGRDYKGHSLNPAFASDLSPLIREHRPTLWVHGHVHSANDYRIGQTRIISNPMGYALGSARCPENRDFDASLILSI